MTSNSTQQVMLWIRDLSEPEGGHPFNDQDGPHRAAESPATLSIIIAIVKFYMKHYKVMA